MVDVVVLEKEAVLDLKGGSAGLGEGGSVGLEKGGSVGLGGGGCVAF